MWQNQYTVQTLSIYKEKLAHKASAPRWWNPCVIPTSEKAAWKLSDCDPSPMTFEMWSEIVFPVLWSLHSPLKTANHVLFNLAHSVAFDKNVFIICYKTTFRNISEPRVSMQNSTPELALLLTFTDEWCQRSLGVENISILDPWNAAHYTYVYCH